MTKLKVFAISGASNAKWIDNHQIVDNIDDCDAVLFPGGSDWNPKLYDEVEGKYTSSYSEVDIHQLKYLDNIWMTHSVILKKKEWVMDIHLKSISHSMIV